MHVEQARCLHDYVTYAEACGDGFVRSSTVLDWASTTPSPRQAQVKLRYVCDLASVLHADDERHEVPDRDALGKARSRRPSPHLLSLAEIRRIMDAALELAPAGSITPLTFHYILGLIAATGLRRSEATSLLLTDLTADGLLIRNAKFGKRRLVPLDGSVHRAMDAYLRERKRSGGPDEHLFVLSTGRPMHPVYLSTVFVKLARRVGLRAGPGEPGPRLHDLRHAFAVRALESTLSAERRDVARHMLTLSTYLGHSNTADTYWYLEATPVLLRQVAGTRDRAMLCLTYNAGLRVSELVGLALDDLKRPALDEVHIIGKGRRERILPLWKETRRALRDWLAVRPTSADRHLFLNAMGTGMTRRGFAKRLSLHAQTAAHSVPSITRKTVSPHLLRHACALHTLEATGDVRKVSLWLGHSSLQTTEMYLQADPTDKLDTLDKWRPPSLRKGTFKGVQDELLAMLAGT